MTDQITVPTTVDSGGNPHPVSTIGGLVDHELAPASKHEVDQAVAVIGLPTHPTPRTIAGALRDMAKQLEADGTAALKAAAYLAARGWPKGTLGDGTGSRTTSSSTSVETAARVDQAQQDPGHWDDVDLRLAKLLRMLFQGATHGQSMLTDLLSHGQDVDELPPGHGACECCGHFCRPSKNPNDRLRSGYCDACRKAWDRAGRPERFAWAHTRRHVLRDGQAGVCELCQRPWTPVEHIEAFG